MPTSFDPKLFRQKALKHYAETDQFDKLIKITTVPSWIALVLMGLLILFALIWGIFGRIPEYVRGEGILVAESGSLFSAQGPESGGYLISMVVHIGEVVKKDQVIAHLQNNELAKKVEIQQQYTEKLANDFEGLVRDSKQEIATHKELAEKRNNNLKQGIEAAQTKLNSIEGTFNVVQEYFKKGLITRFELLNVTKDYYGTKSEIEQKKKEIVDNQVELNQFIEGWHDRLRELNLKLKAEQHNLNDLKSQLLLSGAVLSPVDGVVTDIGANIGTKVDATTTIATIVSIHTGMDAVVYVPPENGKRIKANMEALVSPSNVKREEYGSIIGKVVTASDYPTNAKSMLAVLQNQELVEKFTKDGAPVAVRVKLHKDAATKSGFRWTSSSGPDQVITPGTLVSVLITVRELPPLSLVIPAMKKLFLGY